MNSLPQEIRSWMTATLGAEVQLMKHSYSNQDDVYYVTASGRRAYLKVASDLTAERDNLIKLQAFLTVPHVLDFITFADKEYLLLSELKGKNMAELVGEWEPEVLVSEFAKAVKALHSLTPADVFSDVEGKNGVVLHGDMSMPNIICVKPGVRGYIDLAKMRLGPAEDDLADALWSLQRNLGPGYGELFLSKYGTVARTEKITAALEFIYTP